MQAFTVRGHLYPHRVRWQNRHVWRTEPRQPLWTYARSVPGSNPSLRNLRFRGRAHKQNGQQSRGLVGYVLRAGGSFARTSLFGAGIGGGALAYLNYRVDEFKDRYVPDWLKDAASNMSGFIAGMDPTNILGEISDVGKAELDNILSKFKLPEKLPELPQLPGLQEAVDQFEELTTAALGGEQAVIPDNPILKHVANNMPPPDQDLMVLTKKLIEIRNLLKTVDSKDNMTLPSIVVIGSQSSGKSSVLEAIVGKEFLPKGSNMVTRRPIELTLIHTPEKHDVYAEFPQLELGKMHDFKDVQRTLTDMNLAVSETECISNKPIELRIYSPDVPDLTLVDLPGYIQIHNRNQPEILKEKITDLCEAYIKEPNIILAVCAADVDLANSEALRASRKLDPQGKRTIGVVTKMDLVDEDQGVNILMNKDYPLQLGYIGVVCKKSSPTQTSQALIRSEDAFFNSHPAYKRPEVMVGTATLRNRLMRVLESHMSRNLDKIADTVQQELDEARYQFKVHYNDRRISPESYAADSIDLLKQRFKEFAKNFGKPQVREEVRKMLEDRLLSICEDMYWNDPRVANLPRLCSTDSYWQDRLDIASGALTKSGVGRSSVQIVVDSLQRAMERLTSQDPWIHHPEGRKKVIDFSNELIRGKFLATVDQVENTIKPYKFEVECSDSEWIEGQKRAVEMLERGLAGKHEELQALKVGFGRRKLRNAMKYLQKLDKEQEVRGHPSPSAGALPPLGAKSDQLAETADASHPFSPSLLQRARSALALQSHIASLSHRLSATKSRQCSTSSNKACCPEIFLSVVAEKLTYTAVMFIWVELLNEYFFQLPREVDERLYYGLRRVELQGFAEENESVKRHLAVQRRREVLENVMEKLKELKKNR
ncbi:P-loop containing nucleoside triphosphate hydrolase protein [Gaertneriomyces semiglobifer]|nr:P-loop containing nucleoside triphosphate hydrolase protein [Gaertneriomyces semiglobifer]